MVRVLLSVILMLVCFNYHFGQNAIYITSGEKTYSVYQRGDDIYSFSYGGGVYVTNKKTGKQKFIHLGNSNILSQKLYQGQVDSKGIVYATSDAANKIIKGKETEWETIDFSESGLDHGTTYFVFVASDDSVWWALNDETNNKRLLIHLKTNGEYEKLDISNIIDEFYLDTWGEDQFGNLYFSNKNKVFTLRDGSWQIFASVPGNSSSEYISKFTFDQENNMWISVGEKGVFQQNGTEFNLVTIPDSLRPQDPYVYDIVSTKDGNMYFSLYNTFYLLRYKDGTWTKIPITGCDRSAFSGISMINDEEDNIWIASNPCGLVKLDPISGEQTYFPYSDKGIIGQDFEKIIPTENQTYIAIGGFGTFHEFDSGYTLVNPPSATNFSSFFTSGAVRLKNGEVWVSMDITGLVKYDGTEWSDQTHILSLPEGDKGVNGILLHEDKLYFATNHGLWVKDGDKITQYSTQNVNLPSDIITCLEKGVNGEIWIGTNKGMVIYDGTNWRKISSSSGSSVVNIYSMAKDGDGNGWIGTLYGDVYTFDGTEISKLPGWENTALEVTSFAFQHDTTWIGTTGWGLFRYVNEVFTQYTEEASFMSDNFVDELFVDKQNNLWIGTHYGGLIIYNEKGITNSFDKKMVAKDNALLFPNPVNKTLYLKNIENVFLIQILDMNGSLIHEKYINNPDTGISENVDQLKPGQYILKLNLKNGMVETLPFIKI
ncbi:MAG: T9SS type A sorting domain-containing protein [Lewinellaceae bacterium]|nr:T9SS type A sorting domain-containing protein [Lewinellaceae bacterium]